MFTVIISGIITKGLRIMIASITQTTRQNQHRAHNQFWLVVLNEMVGETRKGRGLSHAGVHLRDEFRDDMAYMWKGTTKRMTGLSLYQRIMKLGHPFVPLNDFLAAQRFGGLLGVVGRACGLCQPTDCWLQRCAVDGDLVEEYVWHPWGLQLKGCRHMYVAEEGDESGLSVS